MYNKINTLGVKKILITWWAWFIWSHLCEKLIKEWNEVICLDNLFTWNKSNIYHLINDPKFTFVLHDVTQPFWMQVDEIYNLACPASPIYYQKNPIETTKTAVVWAMNMLELATKTKAKILQASTSEIYWDPQVNEIKETYRWNVNPVWPRSCYDEWKRMAETFFNNYKLEYKTDIRIARIFNTYWPNMHKNDNRVISNFITQALENKDITIYWDWNQTRSFQYIDDLIEGLVKLMDSNYRKPINIWNEENYKIIDIAKKILEIIPESKSKIVFKELPTDDPMYRRPNISLARKEIWYEAKIELQRWLKRTINYFKKII